MEMNKEQYKGHVLAISYPSQGHINPILQFVKRLSTTRPIKSTFALTTFLANTTSPQLGPAINIDTFSDGYDTDGFSKAESIETYVATLEAEGRRSLSDLIRRHSTSTHPIKCVIYDSFLPWVPGVAKDHGLVATAFFTQPCTVNYIYYQLNRGVWSVDAIKYPVTVPGLEALEREKEDMPSFVGMPGSYPSYFRLALNQHLNVDMADCVLVNTIYELEPQVLDSMSRHCPILPIGPTLPSAYLDEQHKDDKDYGLPLVNVNDSPTTAALDHWLSTKRPASVIYISFGSLSFLEKEQLEEVAEALKQSTYDFLWVVRAREKPMLPNDLVEEMSALGKGMIIEWCSQLRVLANKAIGCFLTHSGWNSTLEALSVGVPMVGMPQWSDQQTNARLMQDLWRVGLRARGDANGVVRRDEIFGCIRAVMQGERAVEMRANARRWSDLAKQAFARGGSFDRNVDVFLSKFVA